MRVDAVKSDLSLFRGGRHFFPLLFDIFINTIFFSILSFHILLFVDYAKLLSREYSMKDCNAIQWSINSFVTWCNAVGLYLN